MLRRMHCRWSIRRSTVAPTGTVATDVYIYIQKISLKTEEKGLELLLEGLLKSSFHVIPVDHVPPGCYIVCAAVLVLEIVSMFPYVKA